MPQDIYEKIDGVTVHCRVEGSGPPLMLLHGWGGKADSFLPVARHLADRYTVYSLDFPGFGDSDPPPTAWSVDEYAAMLDTFMDRRELTGIPVIAHSFGGRVSILMGARYPQRFAKMVLTDSAGLIPKRGPRYYCRVYSYKIMKKIARCSGVVRLLAAMGIHVEQWIKKRAGSGDYRALSDTMRATFVRVVNQDLKPQLKKIAVSVLLIWGENDRDTPVSFGRIMEREIPDAGLVILKDAGHFAYLDQFAQFIRIVDVFLGGEA